MKGRYFGDINDYRKYGLLRMLRPCGYELAVCWMRTLDDGGPDGNKREYLSEQKADVWEGYDSPLYRALRKIDSVRDEMLNNSDRCILSCIRRKDILPEAIEYVEYVPEDSDKRQGYFSEFLSLAKGIKLVFFDPDNGLEVPSVPYRVKRSSKHIYTDELWQALDVGHSILLYQHFGRKKREQFIAETAESLHDLVGDAKVMSFRSAHVVFFLVIQSGHSDLVSCA